MVVIGGESANTDLDDVWALDLESSRWFLLSNNQKHLFQAKRFHSASVVSQNRIVTFGGCHSEYVHLNDVNVFDFNSFVQSNGADTSI